jgi:hypothetical protein
MDAGLSIDTLRIEIAKLRLSHYELKVEKVVKKGISGSRAIVEVDDDHHNHHHRHLHDIEEIIQSSSLDDAIKEKSLQVFRRLAEAEAKVHQTTLDRIHFHEVGAMDAIIDVVGGIAGMAALGIKRVYCSPLHVGSGTLKSAHGVFPVPAPATAELLKGKPFYSTGVLGELLTPTGAAILTTVSSGFGPLPAMTVEQIGYGAGTLEPDIPNLLRIVIGEAQDELQNYNKEQVAVLEITTGELGPGMHDYLVDKMDEMGALDVFLIPVGMKKDRSGTLVTVTCQPHCVDRFADFFLRETAAISLRWRLENRVRI